jgi:RNA methyltransferase, TrmH family
MLSKKQVKQISSLKEKKIRKELALFTVEGEKSVEEFLSGGIKVNAIYATSAWILKNQGILHEAGKRTEVIEVSENELKKISTLSTPNEVLAVCAIPEYELNIEDLKKNLSLVLDEIKDPGNLGTIIRIADWFEIRDIICSEDCVDAYNPKTVQASMGSLGRVKVHYLKLPGILDKLKGIKVYGALLEGENIYNTKLENKGIIIIGNESRGISESIKRYITQKISIPIFSNNKDSAPESLNAAVATGIICSEFRRREN